MSFVCPFCNEYDVPRHTGSLICIDCEDVRDMVRKCPAEDRWGLRNAWHGVIEMHDMYKFVKEKLDTEEDPLMWITYWNMEHTAVCIELYVKVEGKVGFHCFMLVKEMAHEFVKDPPWEDLFGDLPLEDDTKEYLIESMTELLRAEDPALWDARQEAIKAGENLEAWQSG